MSLSVRKISDEEAETPPEGTPVPPPEHPPAAPDPAADGAPVAVAGGAPAVQLSHFDLLKAFFGEAKARKILAIKRCQVCGGRVRPYTDPKVGAGANRDFGVKPGLRCIKCGRMATL